jgi:hypothetical protein
MTTWQEGNLSLLGLATVALLPIPPLLRFRFA